MKNKTPVSPPWQTALYADGGFAILGQVLERISGTKYEEAIHNILSIPLGLNNTSTTLPSQEDLNALILNFGAATSWGYDNQLTAAYVFCELMFSPLVTDWKAGPAVYTQTTLIFAHLVFLS